MYIAPACEKHSKFRARFIAPLIAFAGTISVASQGTFVYDQQSSDESNLGGGVAEIQPNHPMGQSFTPSLSSIGFVRFYLSDAVNDGLGATVSISLRAGTISGTVLASTDPVSVPNGFHGTLDFLFPSSVAISSGSPYVLQPIVQSGGLFGVYSYNTFMYPGGTAIFQGVPNPNLDLWFREGIIIPEPTSGVLLLFGLAAFLYVHRARMRKIEQI